MRHEKWTQVCCMTDLYCQYISSLADCTLLKTLLRTGPIALLQQRALSHSACLSVLRVCVCVCVCVRARVSFCRFVSVSVCLSVSPCLSVLVCLSVLLCLSVCLPACLPACQSVCLCLSACLHVCLPARVCPSVWPVNYYHMWVSSSFVDEVCFWVFCDINITLSLLLLLSLPYVALSTPWTFITPCTLSTFYTLSIHTPFCTLSPMYSVLSLSTLYSLY